MVPGNRGQERYRRFRTRAQKDRIWNLQRTRVDRDRKLHRSKLLEQQRVELSRRSPRPRYHALHAMDRGSCTSGAGPYSDNVTVGKSHLRLDTSDTEWELPLSLQLTLLVRKARFLLLVYTSSSFGYGDCYNRFFRDVPACLELLFAHRPLA